MQQRFRIMCIAWLFEVPFSWALERRIEYLQTELLKVGDEIKRATRLRATCGNEVEKILAQGILRSWLREYRLVQGQIKHLKYGHSISDKERLSDEVIQRAREYPIENLVGSSKRGMVCCPFHDDQHPSASIKNNKLHCFACNRTWGTIDFIMEKEGVGFKEAVTSLR
jgi:hypothetical protein